MSSWDSLGDVAGVAQLTGINAVQLISMIVRAANTARMHKKNCKQFAQHLKLIGNLLDQLKISELKKYPETREPLEQLEDALRRSYILINSCQDRSYLYLLAMGWNVVYQFRKAQSEIDRYLRLVPLINLVDNARVRVIIHFLLLYFCFVTVSFSKLPLFCLNLHIRSLTWLLLLLWILFYYITGYWIMETHFSIKMNEIYFNVVLNMNHFYLHFECKNENDA